jgi:Uma2 family endonuclease
MATPKLMTAEEFARITDIGRFDLIDGELISMSPAGGYQGEVASQFVRALLNHSDERQPGKVYTAEASFMLQRDPDVVLAPDAAFVRASRLPPLAERLGFLPVAPDLAVEIVSPSDRMTEVRRKISTYLMLGTPLVVMVEPRHCRVTLYRPGREPRVLHEGDVIDGDDVLPGFQLPVSKLFE